MMKVLMIKGCRKCGGSAESDYCRECNVAYWNNLIDDATKVDYLDEPFKSSLVAKYRKHLKQLT